MKFKSFVLVLTLVAATTTGCLRRPPTVTADNSAPGYISESACLRLISGQSYTSVAPEVKRIVETKPLSCAESCECNCTAAVATAKKVTIAPVSTKTIVKAKPIVSAKPIKTTTTVKKEVVVVDASQKESSARASLKLATKPETSVSPEVSNNHIREVQEALNKKGAKLEVDGQMGERTVRLLKAFQTMNDLPVTGKADEATAKALGISTKK